EYTVRGNRATGARQAMLVVRNVSLAGFSLRLVIALALVAATWALALDRAIQLAVTAAIALGWIASLALARRGRPAKRAPAERAPARRARAKRAIVPQRTESDDAVLGSLGIATDDGELRASCARVARRLHSERLRVVGFVPAEDQVAVPPVLIQLGIAL